MKRRIAIVILALVLVTMLSACGGNDGNILSPSPTSDITATQSPSADNGGGENGTGGDTAGNGGAANGDNGDAGTGTGGTTGGVDDAAPSPIGTAKGQ